MKDFELIEDNGKDSAGASITKAIERAQVSDVPIVLIVGGYWTPGLPIVIHKNDEWKDRFAAFLQAGEVIFERRISQRRQAIHEESLGRRASDQKVSIPLHTEPQSEPSD